MKQIQQFYEVGIIGRSKMSALLLVLLVSLWPTHIVVSSTEEQGDFDVAHQSSSDRLFDEQQQLADRDLPKSARGDGLASLLLKNLRFRQLQRRLQERDDDEPSSSAAAAVLDEQLPHVVLVNKYQRLRGPEHDLLLPPSPSLPHHHRPLSVIEKRQDLTPDELAWVLSNKMNHGEDQSAGERLPTLRFAMRKRQSVSVSELAQLLQNKMKARNAPEENVKLQSLRFGRR